MVDRAQSTSSSPSRVTELDPLALGRTEFEKRLALVEPNHLEGPPDLVMEIVSPESVTRDRRIKFREYETAGVREYWIVDPITRTVEQYAHDGTAYRLAPAHEGRFESAVVPRWYVRPAWLWAEPRPSVLAALAELGVR